jgi:hypothetical protein
MEKSDLEIIFEGYKPGEWVWCLHCERVYQVGEFRKVGQYQLCPYPDCDGSPLDASHWKEKFEPVRGVAYKMY